VRRTYGGDVLRCPRCLAAPLRLIAFITVPAVVTTILSHLQLPTEPPRPAPARLSPQLNLDLDYDPAPVPTTDAVPAAAVRRLFGQLHVRTREDGGVTIDAPPDTALVLAAIFDGMAGLLRAGAGAPVAAGP
jgi:hypothetical protein